MQRVDGIAAGVECFEDVADAQGDGDAGAPVEAAERVEIAVQRQPRNHAQGKGVAERRAVAMEIGQYMQAVGQSQPLMFAQFHDAPGNIAMHLRGWLATGAVQADEMVEQGAGRGLSALIEPDAGQHSAKIGAPDAGRGAVFGGEGHDAAGGPGDQGQMPVDGGHIVGEGPQDTQGASMGIDQAGANAAGCRQAQIGCGRRGETADKVANRGGRCGQGGLVEQIGEANGLQKIGLPGRRLMGEIGPFAGERRLRAGQRACCLPGQEIGQIEHHAGPGPAVWQVALEPHQLGHFHFRRHHAAGILQHMVPRAVALVGLAKGTMVEPDDRVPAVLASCRDGEGMAIPVTHHQRTGGVKTQSRNLLGLCAGDGHGLAHGATDCGPDLLTVVFGVIGIGPMHIDQMLSPAQQVALGRQHAGPGTGGSHIHCNQKGCRQALRPLFGSGRTVSQGGRVGYMARACR